MKKGRDRTARIAADACRAKAERSRVSRLKYSSLKSEPRHLGCYQVQGYSNLFARGYAPRPRPLAVPESCRRSPVVPVQTIVHQSQSHPVAPNRRGGISATGAPSACSARFQSTRSCRAGARRSNSPALPGLQSQKHARNGRIQQRRHETDEQRAQSKPCEITAAVRGDGTDAAQLDAD